jgi:Family of unknown function (DUF5759)
MSSNILFLEDEECRGKLNIDELYDKHLKRDLKQLSIFNKILNRIHKRIHITARTSRSDKYIWFTVPPYLFGEPNYDQGECIGYLVSNLAENGFHVKYLHPNTLFISWEAWVPAYVREKLRKTTGKVYDAHGHVVDPDEKSDNVDTMNKGLLNDRNAPIQKEAKQFTPIDQYKPTNNFVYNFDMFKKITEKTDL